MIHEFIQFKQPIQISNHIMENKIDLLSHKVMLLCNIHHSKIMPNFSKLVFIKGFRENIYKLIISGNKL